MRDNNGQELLPLWHCIFSDGVVIVAAWDRDECQSLFAQYTSYTGYEVIITRLKHCVTTGKPRVIK